MKVSTRYVSDYEYESVNDSGNKMMIDMLPAAEKQHFSPTQNLLGALAACAAVDIVQMMKKKRNTVIDLIIETEGVRRDENPKYFTHIAQTFTLVSPDASEEAFAKVVDLAVSKYCSVASTLREDLQLEHRTVVLKEAPAHG